MSISVSTVPLYTMSFFCAIAKYIILCCKIVDNGVGKLLEVIWLQTGNMTYMYYYYWSETRLVNSINAHKI